MQAVVDGSGNVWVADYGNSRVLMFPPGAAKATRVLGTDGSFTKRVKTDCAAMAKLAGSNANVCQSHCVAGEQVDTQAQALAAALSPQTALTVRVVDLQLVKSVDRNASAACGNDPPATLLFSRFLI